jgi:hypothetical protein
MINNLNIARRRHDQDICRLALLDVPLANNLNRRRTNNRLGPRPPHIPASIKTIAIPRGIIIFCDDPIRHKM